jgi:hypothetical protein
VKALLPILSCGGAVRTAEAYRNGGEATKHFAVAILQFYMRRAISFQIIGINNLCMEYGFIIQINNHQHM